MTRSTAAHLFVAFFLTLSAGASQGGCGSSGGNSTFQAGGPDGGGSGSDASITDGGQNGDGGMLFGDGSTNTSGFQVSPSTLQTITVAAGKTSPTVTFTATYNGVAAKVGWSTDEGNIGTVPRDPRRRVSSPPRAPRAAWSTSSPPTTARPSRSPSS